MKGRHRRRDDHLPRTGGRAYSYARYTVRWRWQIVGGWIIGLVLLMQIPVPPSSGDQLASIVPEDSPAIEAELRSLEQFGFPLSSRTAVVQRDPEGLSIFTQAESVLEALAVNQGDPPPPLLGALPLTNIIGLSGSAGETNTTVLTYLFMNPASGFASQHAAAERYIATHLDEPEDHVVGIAGSIPARAEQARLVEEYLPRLELFTVLAITLLVGFNFRSAVAPLIALVASGLAFVTTIHLSDLLGALLGLVPPAELEPLLVALLLGVVTDYTIFYVSALQARAADSRHWRQAVVEAVASDTRVIVAAGITVSVGTAALLAAESPFFRTFGPAMALSVLVGLAVSVTLVPALLAILGPRVFWPRRPKPGQADATRTGAPATALSSRLRQLHVTDRLTQRVPALVVLVVCVGGLLLASAPLLHLNLGVGFTTSLPENNPVREASRAASAGFAPGITSPTTILLESPGITDDLAELSRLQGLLAQEPGVAGIIGPAQNITGQELGVVLSDSGDAARMLLVLQSDPLDADAVDDLLGIRERLPELATRSGLEDVTISIAGDSALAEGLVSDTSADLGRIAIAGIAVNFLVLAVFLRALVAPLYLLACSILSLTAALGLTVWLFMDVLGGEGLTFYVPFAAAVLLVSLGSDYNIFGVGRVWEAARTRPLLAAIRHAVPESTRAITAAGLTLAVSFGMLAVIPLRPFRELAFAMAVGILLDAVVVRSVLVPCLLTLVGPVSGWPRTHLRTSEHPQGGSEPAPPSAGWPVPAAGTSRRAAGAPP